MANFFEKIFGGNHADSQEVQKAEESPVFERGPERSEEQVAIQRFDEVRASGGDTTGIEKRLEQEFGIAVDLGITKGVHYNQLSSEEFENEGTLPSKNSSDVGTIAEVVSPGLKKGSKILRKARVKIYA